MSENSSVVDHEIREVLERYVEGIPMSRLRWVKSRYSELFDRSLDNESLVGKTIDGHLEEMRRKGMVLLYKDPERNDAFWMSARVVAKRRNTLKGEVEDLLKGCRGAIQFSSFDKKYFQKFKVDWDRHLCCLKDVNELCRELNFVVEEGDNPGEMVIRRAYNLRERNKRMKR